MVSRKQLSDDLSTLLSCAHTHACARAHSRRRLGLRPRARSCADAPTRAPSPSDSTGLFQNVDANVTPSGAGYTVEFSFRCAHTHARTHTLTHARTQHMR
jgi:hypothetical protein